MSIFYHSGLVGGERVGTIEGVPGSDITPSEKPLYEKSDIE